MEITEFKHFPQKIPRRRSLEDSFHLDDLSKIIEKALSTRKVAHGNLFDSPPNSRASSSRPESPLADLFWTKRLKETYLHSPSYSLCHDSRNSLIFLPEIMETPENVDSDLGFRMFMKRKESKVCQIHGFQIQMLRTISFMYLMFTN